jgi:hypothetical protein
MFLTMRFHIMKELRLTSKELNLGRKPLKDLHKWEIGTRMIDVSKWPRFRR